MTSQEDKRPTFDDVECEHLLDSKIVQGNLPVHDKTCMVATQIAGHHVPAHPASCKHCLLSDNPRSDNKVTRALVAYRSHEIRKYGMKRAESGETPTPEQRLGEGPGTELSKMIPKNLEHKGCGCKDFARKMNRWGVEGCKTRFDTIVDHLVKKANETPLLGWVPPMATKTVAKRLVSRAIERASKNLNHKFSWFTAVTTSPRRDCTLDKCIDSLMIAGFEPFIFAEPDSSKIKSCTTVTNTEKKGVFFNWLSSCEYALKNTTADVIMTVQDDSLFHPDSKTFAESVMWPAQDCGFLSLYTPKHYSILPKFKTKQRDFGVNRVYTNYLWGACALIWPRCVLEEVVDHEIIKRWMGVKPKNNSGSVMQKRTDNSHMVANSDTAIGKVMNKMKRSMWFVDPSAVEHVAQHSTIAHGDNKGRRNCMRCADWESPLADQVPVNFNPVDVIMYDDYDEQYTK